jgi:hypothetical protein
LGAPTINVGASFVNADASTINIGALIVNTDAPTKIDGAPTEL